MRAAGQFYPDVTSNVSDTAYLVAWQHNNGRDDDIHGRRVGGSGTLQGTEITIASGSAQQQYPDVAANGAGGGWTVAWQQGASSPDVHVRSLDGTGILLGGEETLAAANAQERPALSYDTDRGRYLAVWEDHRNSTANADVYGQLLRDYTVVIDYTYSRHEVSRAIV